MNNNSNCCFGIGMTLIAITLVVCVFTLNNAISGYKDEIKTQEGKLEYLHKIYSELYIEKDRLQDENSILKCAVLKDANLKATACKYWQNKYTKDEAVLSSDNNIILGYVPEIHRHYP